MTTCPPAASSCGCTNGMLLPLRHSLSLNFLVSSSALCGRNTRRGRRASCRRHSIARDGTPIGRRLVLATRNSRDSWTGSPACPRQRGLDATSRAAGRRRNMLKVAIMGCGKIADVHASQILRIKGCEIVGVCDREPLMARQLYERYPVKHYFGDLQALLSDAQPDVVHITTPPDSHFEIARICLEWGCHVYVEKPLTLDEAQARRLIALADERGRKVTVGHDDQFSPVARRMRALVQRGYLGSGPVHMESQHCYDVGQSGFAQALLGDSGHWVRKLPGKLLQNLISHGIARIAEFLSGPAPQVLAYGIVSPILKKLSENEIVD